MLNKIFVFAVLLTVSSTSFAASEIHDSLMPSMKEKIGNISVNVKNGTFAEAMIALNKEADAKGAEYYRITSLTRTGMSSDVRATAAIYK